MILKVCNTCKEPKELVEYHKCAKQGVKSSCKLCRNQQNKSPSGRRNEQRRLGKEGKKRCGKCDKVLDHINFGPSSNPNGYAAWCRPCTNTRPQDSKDKRYHYHLLSTYGISLEEYNARVAECNSKCQCCDKDMAGTRIDSWTALSFM